MRPRKQNVLRVEQLEDPCHRTRRVQEVLRSPGKPLGLAVRALMEEQFGRDFGRVRLHT